MLLHLGTFGIVGARAGARRGGEVGHPPRHNTVRYVTTLRHSGSAFRGHALGERSDTPSYYVGGAVGVACERLGITRKNVVARPFRSCTHQTRYANATVGIFVARLGESQIPLTA